VVRIGDVGVRLLPSARPELIPWGVAPAGSPIAHQSPEVLGASTLLCDDYPITAGILILTTTGLLCRAAHLRWMMQKDKLGQDMFLIGCAASWRQLPSSATACFRLVRAHTAFLTIA
jgi:hypothetical protein